MGWLAWAATSAFLLVTPAAAAPSELVDLRWDAPEQCPSRADVLHAITSQLGATFASDTRIQASGRVWQLDGGEYALDLSYSTSSGSLDQRHLEGTSCASVAEAAALVLALALDPERVLAESTAEPSAKVAPSSERAVPNRSAFTLHLLGELDTAVFRVPTFAPGARFGWRYAGLELSVAFRWFVPRDRSRDDITLQLRYWSIDVGACYLVQWDGWAFGPCARFETGRLSAAPRGAVDEARTDAARAHAATLEGTVRVPLGAAFRVVFDAGLEWVARRPQFQVTGSGTVASPAVFGLRLSLGPALVF